METKKNLMSAVNETGILPEIQQLNFEKIKHKMGHRDSLGWPLEQIERAENEYKRYLTLIKLNFRKRLVPSKLMDEFWHMHILDTKAYREDCHKVFGDFIDHYPYFGINGEEDKNKLLSEFEQTKNIYKRQFKEEMGDAYASRCEDHPCHVPSECACRVAGACN